MKPASAAVIAFIAGAFLGGFPTSGNARSLSEIVRDPVWTDGVVVAREPENHDQLIVNFMVDGASHTVISGFVGPPNPRKNFLVSGASVRVCYSRTDPDNAVLEDPERRLNSERWSSALAALMVGSVLSWTAARAAHRLGG
jgi:hypothetical protein